MSTTSKRGRPRKPGPREPGGRLQRAARDRGTPELQAHRAALVGGGDPILAESPVGVLLARGLITADEAAAAQMYARLYARAVRRPCPPSASAEVVHASGSRPTPVEAEEDARVEEMFRAWKAKLLAAGRRVCDVTENVVVFGRFPRFLDSAGRRPESARRADDAEIAAVRAGFAVLAACCRRMTGGRAAA